MVMGSNPPSQTDSQLRRSAAPSERARHPQVEVSVVIPCLNEVRWIAVCIKKALAAFQEAGVIGEVVVADNGSTDGSIAVAEEHGARVVDVARRGYGNALRAR